ncbi:MAG: N-acetyl-alpha-D-glucosaminyl L-malate synthase BshA [Bacteroidetes bacterium]|nr:N-acetyl-alpha-D-glucosaminyl L-malate synthase BshA [Bacteroidota bacterium]
MKIGIVCYPTYGGSGVIATELGKALAKQGHIVHFITYSQPVRLDAFAENIFYHEVSVIDYPLFEYPPYELMLTGKMVDVAKYHQLDLLHVHYAIPHASAAWHARMILEKENIRLPFVTTLHGTDITLLGQDRDLEPVINFAIDNSDAVTCVSQWLKKETLKYFKVNKEIKVIPNFINLKNYGPDGETQTLRKQYVRNEKILVHVSNFRPVKRVADAVRVFELIRKKIPAKLILVGDGPDMPKVTALCRALKVCDDIIITGMVRQVEKLLAIGDLFLLPSEEESFGLAALEAMASGVPVIATGSGGIPEVIEHEVCGLLNRTGDIAGMAKNALHILQNEKMLARYRKNARKRAEHFAAEKILPYYFRIYKELMDRG